MGRHVIDIDTPHRHLILMVDGVSSAQKTTSQYYQININNNVKPSLVLDLLISNTRVDSVNYLHCN